MATVARLFPPFLNFGSEDKGPNGPVRYLQNTLIAYRPRLAAAIGLVPDGKYGKVMQAMVIIIQDEAVEDRQVDENFEVDGHTGTRTRGLMKELWRLDVNAIPFVEGGECMYMAPDSAEPQLWDRAAAEAEAFVW